MQSSRARQPTSGAGGMANSEAESHSQKLLGIFAEQYSVDPTSKALRGEVPPIQKYSGQPALEREAFALNDRGSIWHNSDSRSIYDPPVRRVYKTGGGDVR